VCMCVYVYSAGVSVYVCVCVYVMRVVGVKYAMWRLCDVMRLLRVRCMGDACTCDVRCDMMCEMDKIRLNMNSDH